MPKNTWKAGKLPKNFRRTAKIRTDRRRFCHRPRTIGHCTSDLLEEGRNTSSEDAHAERPDSPVDPHVPLPEQFIRKNRVERSSGRGMPPGIMQPVNLPLRKISAEISPKREIATKSKREVVAFALCTGALCGVRLTHGLRVPSGCLHIAMRSQREIRPHSSAT